MSSRGLLGQVLNTTSPFWGSRIMNDGKVYENLAVPKVEIQGQAWIALFPTQEPSFYYAASCNSGNIINVRKQTVS